MDTRLVDTVTTQLLEYMGSDRFVIQAPLLYFKEELVHIAQGVREKLAGGEESLLFAMMAKRCREEATRSDGTLQFDLYRESVRGKEHTGPVERSNVYATCITNPGRNTRFRSEQDGELLWKESWSGFSLVSYPAPLLFNPEANTLFQAFDFYFDQKPQYLFRTYDSGSYGQSDEDIVASPARADRILTSKKDIFSLDENLGLSIVDRHMNPWRWKDYTSPIPDNFMSWTTSLLYAIQYALYRRHRYGSNSADIKICMIDTRRFHDKQFIHAKRLLEAYYKFVKRDDIRHFYDTRLLVYIYQFGEYLSQGEVYHAGRSCTVSLASLEDNGLLEMYPEFADPRGHATWAIRTLELRSLWGEQQKTSEKEMREALTLARSCFASFDALDVAVVLLSFSLHENKVEEWARKPQEVRQYFAALEVVKSRTQQHGCTTGAVTDEDVIQSLFESS
ncbi:uncharacterized protein PG998_011606 [Apiospora kogelbergensis]|uniref:uncharacterized protein n=1 Tax=Apiospora kogelbergensis TaxID=1337665 RepID=UPI00312DA664